jgi:hypothetical protein
MQQAVLVRDEQPDAQFGPELTRVWVPCARR